jgi:hypothetical protein
MKEIKFTVMIEEGNGRFGCADWTTEDGDTFFPTRGVRFDTYEEAHAHMKELATTWYKDRNEILFVDVLIEGGGDTLVTRNGRCTCSLKEGENLYD